MKFSFIIAAMLVLTVTSSLAARTQEFDVDGGRKVNVTYNQSGSEMDIKGSVGGGDSCKQFELKLTFDNSKKSSTTSLEVVIDEYNLNFDYLFEDVIEVYSDDKYKKGWYVSNIYTKCVH